MAGSSPRPANITDNDLPSLAINDVSITEGNAGTQVLNFTVTRTSATPFAVGFNFATADGTATTSDSDYVAVSGTGTIPSGGATGTTTVSVTINGDAIFENNESFFVNLTEVSLAPAGVVIYRLNVTAPLAPERTISQTASVSAKAPTTDTDATNNTAADIDPMGLLADGYEDAAVTE